MKISPRWTALMPVLVLCSFLLPGNAAAETSVPTNPPAETTAPAPGEEPPEDYHLYFGQLHAHTDLSDGEGTVEDAFANASGVEGLDFFAVTEHSQGFDNDLQGSLMVDGTGLSEKWARGKAAAAAVSDGDFVGMFGFEMTWNQGQGHMNTYNTPGWLSRNQESYQSYAEGMENYYAALLAAEGSVSQFNHPGVEYGDFKDFASYSPALDQRIALIEVSGGVDAYNRALERGWHLAPTNSQNTHSSSWESDARTVILSEELTEQGLYEAMLARRVYATEDRDLEIYYTLSGEIMGSVVPTRQVQGEVEISAQLRDPTDSAIGTVDVIGPGGQVLATRTVSAAEETVHFQLPPEHGYYYLRITQGDGDVAVTAPVWLDGEGDMGISALKTASELTTAGQMQTFSLTLYNQEQLPLTVSSLTLTDQETGAVLYTASDVGVVEPLETLTCSFTHSFAADGVYQLEAAVQCLYDGESRHFREALTVTVLPKPAVDQVIVDASHGNIPGMEHLISLAAKEGMEIITAAEAVTAQNLKTCRLLIIPAPASELEEPFIQAVADFVRQGGSVLLCGAGDGVDRGDFHTADAVNRLLEAMGSTMTLYDDTALDYENNSGEPSQLYTGVFGEDTCLESLREGQVYEQDSGGTVNPGGGTWLVKGFPSAHSADADGDGLAGTREAVVLAVEDSGFGGRIFLSGSMFLSDDGIGKPGANPWALPSANQTIAETILGLARTEQITAPISQVRKAEKGRLYLVEGLVSAGTANPNTTFSDTIYMQDATGGIALMPYSAHGLELGRRLRVLGELGEADGNPCLEIVTMEILEKEEPIQPEKVGLSSLGEKNGQLLQLEGTVVQAEYTVDGEGVLRFSLEDSEGSRGEVLIESNIRSGSTARNTLASIVQEGFQVSAVGISYISQGAAVLRVRDCDEVTLLWSPPEPEETQPPTEPPTEEPTEPPTEPSTEAPTKPPTEAPTTTPTQAPTIPPTEPTVPPETKPKPTEAKPQTTKPKETTVSLETRETEIPTTEAPAVSTETQPSEIVWMEPAVTALEPPHTGDYGNFWWPLLVMVVSLLTVFMLMKQNVKATK